MKNGANNISIISRHGFWSNSGLAKAETKIAKIESQNKKLAIPKKYIPNKIFKKVTNFFMVIIQIFWR